MTFLSSPYAERYRIILLIGTVISFLALIYFLIDLNDPFKRLIPIINTLILTYFVVKGTAFLKVISHDGEYLYIKEKGQEEMLPLRAIKKVELKTMGGRWEIHFHPSYTGREKVVFLPSLLYPLNFKKVERRINDFHEIIDQARRKNSEGPPAEPGLASSYGNA